MTSRRELTIGVALCLLGSTFVLWGVSRDWVSFSQEGPGLTITGLSTTLRGHDIASAARALGYVGLAGVVAVAATRRWGRVLVGLLVLAAGVGVVADVAGALRHGLATYHPGPLRTCRGVCEGPVGTASPGWAWLSLAGGVLLALGGLLVAVRGGGWGGLSSSYEAPGGDPEPPVTDKGVWDALDRGDDPTA